jgi:hypothetical protein
MREKKNWYIEARAEQLAILYLSRRDDLKITKSYANCGPDFLVSVCKDHELTGRVFGVQIKGIMSLKPISQGLSDGNEIKLNIGKTLVLKDIPFPLCLFAFAMDNDEGYVRWIKEPVVNPEGRPTLLFNKAYLFKKLTKEELDHIVEQVNLWYEKRAGT